MSKYDEMYAAFHLLPEKMAELQSMHVAEQEKHKGTLAPTIETVVLADGERTVIAEEKRNA